MTFDEKDLKMGAVALGGAAAGFALYKYLSSRDKKAIPLTHDLKEPYLGQFQRSLGLCVFGGGDLNEMYLAAQKAGSGDNMRWYDAWDALAEKTFQAGKARLTTNPQGAASAYLRACNYWRTSAFFIRGHPEHDDIKKIAYKRADDAFRTVMSIHGFKETAIPLSDGSSTPMLCYYARASSPPVGMKNSPLLIASTGWDGDIVEVFLLHRIVFEKYGFNLLLFDGPGQGAGAVLKGTAMRHDWEVVVGSVIDFATKSLGFDLNHGLVSYGLSLGGHLNTRAALHETRPHVYILDPLHTSKRESLSTRMPGWFLDEMLSDRPGSSWMGRMLLKKVSKPGAAASLAQVHGFDVTTKNWFPDFCKELFKFYLDPKELEKLQVPVILCAAENDQVVSGDQKAHQILPLIKKSPVGDRCVVIDFTVAEGAGAHCEGCARSLVWERVMDHLVPLLRSEIRRR